MGKGVSKGKEITGVDSEMMDDGFSVAPVEAVVDDGALRVEFTTHVITVKAGEFLVHFQELGELHNQWLAFQLGLPESHHILGTRRFHIDAPNGILGDAH
ncbi:hypothetical protein L2E82_18130 [Cichorium intybus]|uniref:Uncharacterized protein n=1 Tax=Cichorium intybus TaxID=13427 RepID=A0ACB9F9G4_CICIN|nr:hypothetical protein L2E82_18130 [Cichorium intybus]